MPGMKGGPGSARGLPWFRRMGQGPQIRRAPQNKGAQKRAITAIASTLLKIAYSVLKTGTAVRRPRRRVLHPPRIPRCQAGLPDAAAPETEPRLRHHHHPPEDPATAKTTRTPDPPQEPPSPVRSTLPAGQLITMPAAAGNHPGR